MTDRGKGLNDCRVKDELLHAAMRALEDILNEGLNFSTEQAAEVVVRRIQEMKRRSSSHDTA